MEVKFFSLNDKKYLERSTDVAFFASITENKSLYWVDIFKPDLPRLVKFMSPLRLHP